MTESTGSRERTASCGCDNLTVTTSGESSGVWACTCVNCQRETGSTFGYFAMYPEAAVSIAGERKVWRRLVDSGRWFESEICPTCGSTVIYRMEFSPDSLVVPVGCFADSDFAKPEGLYWVSRGHRWLQFPDGIDSVETQPT
ncbi:MAG: GFA family protein [Alphaproteobacteria bacterium]